MGDISIKIDGINSPRAFRIFYKPLSAPGPTPSLTPAISLSVTPTITPTITPTTSGCGINPYLSGLVGCWNLEESSGTLYDSSGNGNDFTAVSGITYNQPGKVGTYCINVPITNSYVRDGSGSNLELTTYSVSCWIKTTANTNTNRIILSKGAGTDGGYQISLDANAGHIQMHNYSISNQGKVFLSTPVNDGVWHHIIVTYNSVTKYTNCYIDASLTPGCPFTNTVVPGIPSTPNDLHLGNDLFFGNYNPNYVFNGDIDAVSLFNRELNYCDVINLYNSGNGITCPSTSLPVPSTTPMATPSIIPSVTPSIAPSTTPSVTPSITPTPTPSALPILIGFTPVTGNIDFSGIVGNTISLQMRVTASASQSWINCMPGTAGEASVDYTIGAQDLAASATNNNATSGQHDPPPVLDIQTFTFTGIISSSTTIPNLSANNVSDGCGDAWGSVFLELLSLSVTSGSGNIIINPSASTFTYSV